MYVSVYCLNYICKRLSFAPAFIAVNVFRKDHHQHSTYMVLLSTHCLFSLSLWCVWVACTVIIPSAKEIQASRRQRREARAQKEFIPLGRDGQTSPGSTPSRSSREDDEDGDDDDEPDDHERRIEFAPRSKSIKERIAEKLGMREEEEKERVEREGEE